MTAQDYERDASGRITKVGKRPFDIHKAHKSWTLRYPDGTYRRFVLSEVKRSALQSGHEYTAQCVEDMLEALRTS